MKRFDSLFQAVDFLINSLQLNRSDATSFVLNHSFRIDTDKGFWIDVVKCDVSVCYI